MSRDEAEGVRLQKVLADAGIGSRRACEELIEQRRVSVNGEVVRQQGLIQPRMSFMWTVSALPPPQGM